jgi:hypothetical protein
MTLTVTTFRQRVETAIGDEALDALLTDTYEAIARVLGPAGPLTEVLTADAGDVLLLSRPAASIDSVIEEAVELDPTDYGLKTAHLLIRLTTGVHPSRRWRGRPEITYLVRGDDAERDRIALALASLELTFKPGLASQHLGQWSESYQTSPSYAEQRDAIFASYHEAGGFI